MKIFFFKIIAVSLVISTKVLGQNTEISCVSCSSVFFREVGFTDLELFRDLSCEHGVGAIDACPAGHVCASIIGIETQNIAGYGETDLHVVIRGCEDAMLLGTTHGAKGCLPADQHTDYLATNDSDTDVQFVSFEGDICYCSEDFCNNVMAPPVVRPALQHTPPPNTPGLQCRYCSHTAFHDDSLNDPTLTNFDCEDGQLASTDVYYTTCPAGSVCLNMRGQVTYSFTGFDVTADVHDRRCFFVGDTMNEGTGCVDQTDISDYQLDYYSYFDDITFEGGACYCRSDLCDCDTEVCLDLESSGFTCANNNLCSGLHEICVDGFIRPRCVCEEGYGFDENFQCQKVAESCITCISRHFLGEYTSSTLLEDLNCEAGLGEMYSCAEDSVCATLVGTETNWYEGYGAVKSKVVQRGCERRPLFDEVSPCLSDPLSADIFNFHSDFPRINFTGEACYCSDNNCNSELKEIERVVRPHIPVGDPRGLQCVACLSRHSLNPTEASNSSLDEACIDGDLTNPNVYYVTCPSDQSCLKVEGVIRFFLGAEFAEYLLIERRCVPNTYTMGSGSGCVSMDDIGENLEEDYSSYYFYFDAIEIEAPACYCSTDLCDCNLDTCKTDSNEGVTCESEGVCDKPHENCHDTTTAGPVCFCESGYSYDANRDCVADGQRTCESEDVCSNPNEVCSDTDFGPECICDVGYERNSEGDCDMTRVTCQSKGVCDQSNEVCRDTTNGPICSCADGHERSDEGDCVESAPSCADGDLCTQSNEHCEDISDTPTCVCDTGYQYNMEGNCVQGVTCRSEGVCDQPNEVCGDTTNGPICSCADGHERSDEGDCVESAPSCADGDFCTQSNEHCEDISDTPTCVCDTGYQYNKEGNCVQEGSKGSRGSQPSHIMFWILAVTGVILTRQ